MLYKIVKTFFEENEVQLENSTANLIIDALQSSDLVSYRSLQLIKTLPHEIRRSGTDVQSYLMNPNSPLCMMAGHPLMTEKGK